MLPLDFLVQMLEKFVISVHYNDSEEKDLNQALFELENAAHHDLDQFLCFMSVVLADNQKYTLAARRGAALQLKLYLRSKDPVTLKQKHKRWKIVPTDVREMIKSNVLLALTTASLIRPSNATEIAAYIAAAELPLKDKWPDLMPTLSDYVVHLPDEEKESALEAMAFVCQDMKWEMLVGYSKDIMAAVLTGFRMEKLSERGRVATITILLACFELLDLENLEENKTIMQAIRKSIESSNIDIRVGGLALLVKIASCCYHNLEGYMDDVIVSITTKAINSEEKRIHVQGLEFWKAISQVEDPRDSGGRLIKKDETNTISNCYVKNSLGKLVPTLFSELIRGALSENLGVPNWVCEAQQIDSGAVFQKIENGSEKDVLVQKSPQNENVSKKIQSANWWSPPKEVIIYMSELCENYPEAIDCYVLPLVQTEIQHADWRNRHAALWSMLAFLKQMAPHHAENALQPCFPFIRKALRDKASSRVRSTALWVTSWMFEKYPPLVLMVSTDLQQLVEDVLACLNDDEGRVSPSSCITLVSLAKAAYTVATREVGENQRPPTFALTPYLDMITDQLVKAANRRLTAAFDAIRQVLLYSPDDCYWVVLDTTDELLILLRKMIVLPEVHPVGCHCHESVQKILCGVLRSVMKLLRLGETTTHQLGHKFLTYLLDLLTQFRCGLAREEALLATSKVASLLSWELKHHLETLVPYLTSAITTFPKNDPGLPLAVDLIGTIFRVLDWEATPCVNKLLGPLLALTERNRQLPMDVMIRCVAVFGQMATAVGRPGFQMYMAAVLRRLQYCVELSTEELNERVYNKELREILRQTCIETHSCLVSSVLHRGSLPLTLELCSISLCLKNITRLIESVTKSKTKVPQRTCTAFAHLIGNLLVEFGAKKALDYIPLGSLECKLLLTEAVNGKTLPTAVLSICQEALLELQMAG